MLIAQITDLHLRPPGLPAYRVSETNMLTARAVDALLALDPRPDVVLVTGDVTDCGLPEEYALADQLLARLPMPVLLVPGNHDRRESMRASLARYRGVAEDETFVQYVVDDFAVRLIGLDTVVPGESHGALCATRLAFLEAALAAAPAKPTIIFMHHPPFDCGIAHMDAIRLLDGADAFRAIVARHGNVERILCGHHHRPIEVRFAGTICAIAPAVTHQVVLDLSPASLSAFVMEPPAFRLHLWQPGIGIVSHTGYVERFPGPFPFVLDAAYPGRHV